MATRDEKEALEAIKVKLVGLVEDFVKQADAVTDRTTRTRIIRKAGELLRVATEVSDLVQ